MANIITRGYQRHFKIGTLTFIIEAKSVICVNPNGIKFSKVEIHTDGIFYKPYSVMNGDVYYTPNQWEATDFLRSRGYLLPFMGLSTDEIIAAGWVKVNNKV